ncbi:universal stress protein [Amphritea sp.]|uniref:universal stress protein n=1 Tax=Amphritea sp. TaxID=1872502 RepID=UPI003A8E6D90
MLPKTKHILYASDMGKASRPAFFRAVSEAIKHDAKITYLHVMEPMNRSTETMIESYLSEDVLEALRDKGAQSLKHKMTERVNAAIQEELKSAEIPAGLIEHHLEAGKPSDVIIKVAEQLNADMIVMGTRTHSSIGKLLMGSTAQKVLQAATVPVLVVPL